MKRWLTVVIMLVLNVYVVLPVLLKTGVLDGSKIIPLPIALSGLVLYSGTFIFALIQVGRKVLK